MIALRSRNWVLDFQLVVLLINFTIFLFHKLYYFLRLCHLNAL